jgi:hypothetical protein
MEWKRLLVTLALAAGVLGAYREVYWRPFDDVAQESVPSFHSFGFAAASTVHLWPNPLAARDVDLAAGRVTMYPHWTNTFFLVLEAAVHLFGATETVGRSVAILGSLLAFTLIAVSLDRKTWLVYAAVPLVLLSGPGRDDIPFVFADVALYVAIGVLYWTASRPSFRGALLAALVLNPLVLPYALVVILLRRVARGSNRQLGVDLGILAGGGVVVAAALVHASGGFRELGSILQLRSQWPLADLTIALRRDVLRTLNLEPLSNHFVAAAWVVCLLARQWRTAALLPSFLFFSLLLREYVATHEFTRLPLVFFSLVTVGAALEVILAWLEPKLPRAWTAGAVRILLAAVLAVRVGAGTQRYVPEPRLQAARQRLFQIVDDPANAVLLERCNVFTFSGDRRRWLPDSRMGQFFFGRRVADRVRRGGPLYPCRVDLDRGTVEDAHRTGPASAGHAAP